jgi:hypothetical protein
MVWVPGLLDMPNWRTPVNSSRWSRQAHTRHHRSPRGENHRPVCVGFSRQCVACSCCEYTIRQHRTLGRIWVGSNGNALVGDSLTETLIRTMETTSRSACLRTDVPTNNLEVSRLIWRALACVQVTPAPLSNCYYDAYQLL